jgi:hypothetical protein
MSRRASLLLLVAVTGTALLAVSNGFGTPPDFDDVSSGPNTVPAGVGCPFAVRRIPEKAFATRTTFSDGTVQTISRGEVTLINLATGQSTVWYTANKNTRTPGVDGADDTVSLDGSTTFVLRPGEANPLGGVGPRLLGLKGASRNTVDPDTNLRTSFSFTGEAIDLCAVLAE